MDTAPKNQAALVWNAPRPERHRTTVRRDCAWALVLGVETLSGQILEHGGAYGFEVQVLRNGELFTSQRCASLAFAAHTAATLRAAFLGGGWTDRPTP
jgi:hypothetical protein